MRSFGAWAIGKPQIVSRTTPLARLAAGVLVGDPGVGLGQAVGQRSVRLPVEDAADHGVVAVAAAHAPRGVELIVPPQLHARNLLDHVTSWLTDTSSAEPRLMGVATSSGQ